MQILSKYLKIIFLLIVVIYMHTINVNALDTEQIDYEKIDRYIYEEMDTAIITGLTLTIVYEDQIIYQKIYQTKEYPEQLTLDSPFYIGSISKSITALAIKQLTNKGLINIDDYISDYLPWFTLRDANDNEIKIRNLMNHTSGFTTADGNLAFTYQSSHTIETLVRKINSEITLKNIVGEVNEYSNLNYVVLGAIVESVSGLSYENYVTQNIYKPLRMTNTYHSLEEAEANGLYPSFRIVNSLSLRMNLPLPTGQVPAGYLVSSTHDMTNYLIMFLNRGNFEKRSLFDNNDLIPSSNLLTYDAYWQKMYIPSGYFGHAGATFSSTSQLIINQKEKLGILILTNSRDVSSTNPISASTISEGIIMIMQGGNPINLSVDVNWIIVLINGLCVFIVLIDILLLMKYVSKRNKNKNSVRIIWGIIDGVVPVSLLFICSICFQSSWTFMIFASPEYTLSIFFGCLSLLVVFGCRTFYDVFTQKR